jgi:hypothetical protein
VISGQVRDAALINTDDHRLNDAGARKNPSQTVVVELEAMSEPIKGLIANQLDDRTVRSLDNEKKAEPKE